MERINAYGLDFKALNEKLRQAETNCAMENCCGQRFLAAGMADTTLSISGVPGNALGAYLNGAQITVNGNAQDAVGDTMNAGRIVICGSVGDAVGYAMRGGEIFVRQNAGYRAGIHMKAYRDKVPALVIGGRSGSFLGEYQAGGRIVVLGLHTDGKPIVGNFPCTGLHGGKVFLRGSLRGVRFPPQVNVMPAAAQDLAEIEPLVNTFCALFSLDTAEILGVPFTVVTPNHENPFRQMYVAN
ncbi:MAG: glutamate synthase [Clostridia bacterium]|nr:glutamate synthase [Clostridia bacterium]MBR3553912.1 glutamate synthase [Clostridia bacterium]